MDENNPYRGPQSVVADPATGEVLAGRGTRFGAALVDTLIALAVVLPVMYLGGYFEQAQATAAAGRMFAPIGTIVLWALIGFALFVLVQAYPLHASGQTWGKRLLSIKIVDLAGNKPSLGRLLGLRYFPLSAISNIPVVGMLYALVDVLLIFREDRRCLHDLIAGTRVVTAS